MSKRNVESIDGEQAYQKRQRISGASRFATTSSSEEIQSARQLRQLITFDQDVGRARHGIQSFKVFLDGLAEEDKAERISILKEFLQLNTSRDEDDKDAIFLSDIMLTWGLAGQSNNEALLSAVPAVLALLFKTISGKLDLVEYGLRLGRAILQKNQAELLARGLAMPKQKDFIIAPCLRLLRELVIFDGGALAKAVFKARENTFKGMGRNLGLRHLGEGVEDRRKPSIRTNALRFFLACAKFLPTEEKKEMLKQRDVVAGVTREIGNDPAHLVAEFLSTVRTHILQDEKLPREAKSKLLNSTGLGRLVNLYGYSQEDADVPEGGRSVDDLVHEFLLISCTSPKVGLLYRQFGFYPRGVKPDGGVPQDSKSSVDLGLKSIEWAGKFTEKVPVHNSNLSEFIQTLRPWANIKQADLLVAIFEAAPELVADYFFGKKSFTFEPKLTATWIGYAAVLYSTLSLPLPLFFGHQDKYARLPPPSTIVIESILPQPLTQKVLTKCLGQKSDLITFFAIRILVIAFEKMENALKMYREAAAELSGLWSQAAEQLTEEFRKRCPLMKDAILAVVTTPENNMLQRQAGSRLLSLYYQVIPQVALEAKFDVSGILSQTLMSVTQSEKSGDNMMRVLEAENLFHIAQCSAGMKWFVVDKSISVSPFTAMLRLCVEASSDLSLTKILSILDSVANETGILQSKTTSPAVDALITSLRASVSVKDISALYSFLDVCLHRCSSNEVKYIADAEEAVISAHGTDTMTEASHKPLSLLSFVMVEQWPFMVKAGDDEKLESVATFIATYLAAIMEIREDKKVIKSLIKTLTSQTPRGPVRDIISKSKDLVDDLEIPARVKAGKTEVDHKASILAREAERQFEIEAAMADFPCLDEDDNSALIKWTTKDIEEVVDEGFAAALILLLSSPHLSVRKEALTSIPKLAHKLKESTYAEKEQIWLLLNELVETARPHVDKAALNTTITSFATHALLVLQDPLHCMYAKVNKFLSRGPTWEVEKLPLLHAVLNEPPILDDMRWAEITWLLVYLTDALRSSSALEVMRKRKVFEKAMLLYGDVYASREVREKVLKMLYRTTLVEGGSDTLITRFGVLDWVKARLAVEKEKASEVGLRILLRQILASCGKAKVEKWSGKTIEDLGRI